LVSGAFRFACNIAGNPYSGILKCSNPCCRYMTGFVAVLLDSSMPNTIHHLYTSCHTMAFR
jgi:hypothetical protein